MSMDKHMSTSPKNNTVTRRTSKQIRKALSKDRWNEEDEKPQKSEENKSTPLEE